MPARRLPSWAWVSGLTVAAVAAVVVLAVHAADGAKPAPTAAHATSSDSAKGRSSAAPSARPSAPAAPKVPDASGTGRRVVYAVGEKRVWLVGGAGAGTDTPRTFTVWPGTRSPDPGTYAVSTRRESTTGSDGVPIEHIVYFASKSGLSVAFSNAVDGSSPSPSPGLTTAGIRLTEQGGTALWAFATTGTKVVVVP